MLDHELQCILVTHKRPIFGPPIDKHSQPILGTPVDEIIGENLEILRKQETNPKLSQTNLALMLTQLTGTRWVQQTVSMAEMGKRPFNVADLLLIAHIFGVSPIRLLLPPTSDDLIRGKNDRQSSRRDHPWIDTVRIGTRDFWPDDILDTFFVRPRGDNEDAAIFSADADWPEPVGFRKVLAYIDDHPELDKLNVDELDESFLFLWKYRQAYFERQRREHT